MNIRPLITGAAATLAMTASVAMAETGTLKMRFVYDAPTVPKLDLIDPNKDVDFCGKHDIPNEKLIVDADSKGIKNVLVYVYTGRGGTKLDDVPAKNETLTLANRDCRFEPHYVIAQTGDTLKITNPDPVGHNANLNFFANKAENLMIPAQAEKEVALEKPEPAAIPVECNIHPWMRAYVVVLEHPYAAVSSEDGTLVIEGLPTGDVTFRVSHEAGKIDEVKIDGKKESWRRSRFELDIKPGMNDLGDIMVAGDALSAD
ncbi:methylamine utilization protein [Rhodopirellula sp. JC740]|uniref:Methylamine utilization protein n=1 Tax=Rhodopirellula halodulae TaxID=2894198 RepID=A0ABS8NDE1_9BACT|nr:MULTISPECIES: methylamine utilization protein [unclassified Rhodopirellula]MCC9640927.1 methylamine utilization protein [Rhodopirellula sp. JC740]MCC9656465.1 methylamine utilization protein [Rhodopirellula sp. JC737]